MPNTSNLNPLFSPIEDILLFTDFEEYSEDQAVSIYKIANPICKFERMELIESALELFPSGSLTVRDTTDVMAFIKNNELNAIRIKYLDGSLQTFSITSYSYINNSASETEENFVSINFTNILYKFSNNISLFDIMPSKKPIIRRIDELARYIVQDVVIPLFNEKYLDNLTYNSPPSLVNNEKTSNYFLYKPTNTMDNLNESVSDNFLQYLYYISSLACPDTSTVNDNYFTSIETNYINPRYLFWTDLDNKIYFKYFYKDLELDPNYTASQEKNYNYAVYNSDVNFIKLNDKIYKKIYLMTTDPVRQHVRKNYFYIRKSLKILEEINSSEYEPENYYKNFNYQFQDEGEKFKIELISSLYEEIEKPKEGEETEIGRFDDIRNSMTEIKCNKHWGYYDASSIVGNEGFSTNLTKEYGLGNSQSSLIYFGSSGYFPYVDHQDMWHSVYDLTPISPYYKNYGTNESGESNPETDFDGSDSNLQKVIDIRWQTYEENKGQSKQLELLRKVEKQNFVMYVLCCLNNIKDETFYALITGYKKETAEPRTGFPYGDPTGYTDKPSRYLYRWSKLNYGATFGATPIDTKYSFRELEYWSLDKNIKTNLADDLTFAINLNERRNIPVGSNSYLAPGWYMKDEMQNANSLIRYRPIGASSSTSSIPDECLGSLTNWENGIYTPSIDCGSNFNGHIVKMTKTPIFKLLQEAGITQANIYKEYEGKSVYTFDAQNVADGPCPS
jgi:hypothetical protein